MTLLHGDCLEQLKTLADNSVDCVVTDLPYGWRFMGKAWDKIDIDEMAARATAAQKWTVRPNGKPRAPRKKTSEAAGTYDFTLSGNQAFMFWTKDWAEQALRVLKPGGHMLVFCGPRTYHAMAMGVEMAGFEIRDQLQWLFGSGFPKSHNIGNGMGTALKPANEPIVLARKPLEKGLTVAQNVLKWSVGALNIDGCRIEGAPRTTHKDGNKITNSQGMFTMGESGFVPETPTGRWPANVLFDETVAAMLDEQSKIEASRFFYVAKASKRERNAGLEGMPAKLTGSMAEINKPLSPNSVHGQTGKPNKPMEPQQNFHPTVKPIRLMEYLCTLVCPPGGTILDPFTGSGSTGVAAKRLGLNGIGIEREAEYLEIARRRIEHA